MTKVPSFIQKQYSYFIKELKDKRATGMLVALVLGEKRYLNRKFKNKLKLMALNHLVTPSGLHLTSLFLLVFPLFQLFKKKKRFIEILLVGILTFFIYQLPELYSLKRVTLYRLTSLIIKPMGFSSFSSFLLVFGLDFFFGTYQYSPLSFSLSYLFLGLILSSLKEVKIKIPLLLSLAQIIIAYLFDRPTYPISLVLNSLISLLFGFYYPFLFFSFLVKWTTPMAFLIGLFDKVILYAYQLSLLMEPFYASMPLILALGIICISYHYWNGKIKMGLFCCLLFIHSPPLFQGKIPKRPKRLVAKEIF